MPTLRVATMPAAAPRCATGACRADDIALRAAHYVDALHGHAVKADARALRGALLISGGLFPRARHNASLIGISLAGAAAAGRVFRLHIVC